MSQDLQVTLAQVIAQLGTLGDVVAQMQAELSDTPDVDTQGKSVCEVANKDGSECKITPVKGTSVCHIHTRVSNKPPKKSSNKVAKATADLKANRKGAGVAVSKLTGEMKLGTERIYFHSNAGARRLNKSLRRAGWKVGGFEKSSNGKIRSWKVTGFGQTYMHVMGKYMQGQATHHRYMAKAA